MTQKEYHAIVIGGTSYDFAGRPLGPYRIRTACANAGYQIKVIDFAWALNQEQMFELLSCLITDKTLVLGISNSWFSTFNQSNQWYSKNFFEKFKTQFPWIKIVVGGTRNISSDLSYLVADWRFTGFSDISFPILLDQLSGKNNRVKFILEKGLKKVIHSDEFYIVQNMDEIETKLINEDKFLSYQPFTLEVARGCIFKCAFCSHPFLGKKSYDYIRSPESIAQELKRNYELFGLTRYMIADDTFNDSIEKLDRLQKAVDLSGIPKFEFTSYIRAEILVTKPEMIPKLKNLGLNGYHVGIESLNHEARKVVGKGMDIERVLDAVRNLNQNSMAKGHASFILGLPGDTEDDFFKWEEFLLKNRDNLFRSWKYNPLGITRTQDGSAYSDIEKDPARYGYTTYYDPNLAEQFLTWTHSSGMTYARAIAIEQQLRKEIPKQKLGGWDVATAWYIGMDEKEIDKQTADNKFYMTVKTLAIKRAISFYKKITGKILDVNHLGPIYDKFIFQ